MLGYRVVALALVGLLASSAHQQGNVMVGVLEIPQCGPRRLVVRPLFTKTGPNWMAIGSLAIFRRAMAPTEASWTVALEGSSLGTIRTMSPNLQIADVRHRVLDLVPRQQVPQRANSGDRFAGWCGPPPDRPLIVVAKGSVKDPDGWKPLSPNPVINDTLMRAFRRAVDTAFICPTDPQKGVPFAYTARDLQITGAYRSRNGQTIVGLELNKTRNSCDGPLGAGWRPHWFVLGSQPVVLGDGLELVDIGDYDGDGRSELVFWYSGYDRDGYTLFANGFRERADVRWIYH